jgi:hypothetical protein
MVFFLRMAFLHAHFRTTQADTCGKRRQNRTLTDMASEKLRQMRDKAMKSLGATSLAHGGNGSQQGQ